MRFSKTVHAQLFKALKSSFPDAQVSDSDVLALAVCLQREKDATAPDVPQELSAIDLSPYKAELKKAGKDFPLTETYVCKLKKNDQFRYYWADAVHVRKTPSGFQPFTAKLGMVRVTLDATRPKNYRTAFGRVLPADHLIDTVFEANQKYSRALGYLLERVDMITPAREGLRFGAISVLLGYRHKLDKVPSCYILEAGTATGQPKVTYLGREIGASINSYGGYRPTPFSCPDHAYLGTFTLKPGGDEPDQLTISSRTIKEGVSQTPYINVDVRFTRQDGNPRNIWPGLLIARAAGIVLSRSARKTIPSECEQVSPGASHA